MPKKTPRHGFGAGKYEMDLVLDWDSAELLGRRRQRGGLSAIRKLVFDACPKATEIPVRDSSELVENDGYGLLNLRGPVEFWPNGLHCCLLIPTLKRSRIITDSLSTGV